MQHRSCAGCRQRLPVGELYAVGGEVLCGTCGDERLRVQPAGTGGVERLTDPTVCAFCKADQGSEELPRLAGQPACRACTTRLRSRPFPLWLRLSFAGLVVLCALSLVRGVPLFPLSWRSGRARGILRGPAADETAAGPSAEASRRVLAAGYKT